jgi:hypothetical protein
MRQTKSRRKYIKPVLPLGWKQIGECKGSFRPFLVECPNGHRITATIGAIRAESACRFCNGDDKHEGDKKNSPKRRKRKYSNEDIDSLLDPGWRRASEYTRTLDVLWLVCPAGHKIKTTFAGYSQGRRCPLCGNRRKYNNDYIDQLIPEGWKRLSDFLGYQHKIELSCQNGHHMAKVWYFFESQEFRCADCIRERKQRERDEEEARTGKPIARKYCLEIPKWRRTVFERDSYTCQCCGHTGSGLNAHHLYNYSSRKDLRLDVSNGITLCQKCHRSSEYAYHKLCGNRRNTPEQFYQWLYYARQYLALRDLAQPSTYSLLPLAA